MKLSKYIGDLEPYRLTSSSIRDSVISGKDTLKLNWNESTKDLHGGFLNLYGPTDLSIYENLLKQELQLNEFESVLIYSGCDHAHLEACRVYLDCEKVVLIVGPTYDNFRVTAESFGSKIIYFNSDFNDLDCFLEGNKVDFVYICNPNNPTGKFNDVSEIVRKNSSILFCIDEAYMDFSLQSYSVSLSGCENVLVFKTFSKAWALAGVRIGLILSSDKRRAELLSLYNPKFLNKFALEYILKIPEYKQSVFKMVNKTISNRIILVNNLRELYSSFPSEGNFVFFEDKSATDLRLYLTSLDIHVREFKDFHGLTGIRITVPVSRKKTLLLIDALKQFK